MPSIARSPGRFARAAVRLIGESMSPHHCAVRAAERRHPDSLFQPAGDTCPDRHPRLFAFTADQLRTVARPRLLSFGCSTGEEALTLATYFPDASIDGIDLNARSVRIARRSARRHGTGRIRFSCSDTVPVVRPGYNAIFCLSVFRHGELDRLRPKKCSSLIPFERFDAAVANLDATLEPGGLLCIWGANFRFADTAVAHRYDPLVVPGKPAQRSTLYGRDDLRLPVGTANDFVFRKMA